MLENFLGRSLLFNKRIRYLPVGIGAGGDGGGLFIIGVGGRETEGGAGSSRTIRV